MGWIAAFLTPRRATTAATAALAAMLAASWASGQEPSLTAAYFEGLRERGLFGVAERYGLDRRAELPAESAESVQLAVELSRTFAQHAWHSTTAEEQAFLRTRAEEALGEYRGNEAYPRIEAVSLERVYRRLDAAELALWNWTADPDDVPARRSTLEQILESRAALDDWIGSAAASASRPVADRAPDDLSRRELVVLIHAARLKSIDLALRAAELAETTREKDRGIRLAEEVIKRLAGSSERGTTSALKGFAIRIARLTGDENQLRQLVRQVMNDRSSLAARQDAVAELARFELDQGRADAAARWLVDSKAELEDINDRLRALHVEAVLTMATNAGPQREHLLANAREGQANVNGPWRLRNEFLLLQAQQVDSYGADAAALVRRGNREFRAGQRNESIDTFRAAADAATVPAGRAELRFMTASLLVESQRFEEAIAECEHVARDASAPMYAARASLLAAYCRGRVSAKTGSIDDRNEYQRALLDHLNRFPEDETAGDAAAMLGAFAEQTGRPASIVDADRRMPPAHPRARESLERAVRATLGALEQIRSGSTDSFDGRSARDWDADAGRLSQRLLSEPGTDVSSAHRLLNAARLLSAVSAPKFDDVLTLLNRMPQPAPSDDSEEWRLLEHDAAALRLVCLVATARYREATTTLDQLLTISTGDLLDVLRKLNAAGRQLEGARRAELARLELATITRVRLQSPDLTDDDRMLLAVCEAEALFASGRFAEAARMFEDASTRRPELAPRFAEALERTGDPKELARARDFWQRHEAQQKQGSATWFAARLRLARVLLALGQASECRKLILSTRIVYPELGGPDTKRAFEQIELQAAAKPAT
ncbi:hypothetical protein Pan44_33900 [Caulifigura coniformis]|uniref:Tetratricopeptide repeat protein n=1 Tax=Caulifigura coniformis TaxID=2527983 RepID=A0A517SGX0_9PLAN|nr:hypothetical protein [Caulifigura coniformis]QDT55347.1 hypothetical protein Pan44_33900 [Caulifigura coniformis]